MIRERFRPVPPAVIVTGVILVVPAVLLLGGLALLAVNFYQRWHSGYGLACESFTLAERVSPSGDWIARTREVDCSGIGASGIWLEVVLVRQRAFLPFLSRPHLVFKRDIAEVDPKRTVLDIRWTSSASLELGALPCAPACYTKKGDRTNASPCEFACGVIADDAGVAVELVPIGG